MEPKSVEKRIAIGARAQAIYQDIQERIELIRTNLHAEWENTKAEEQDGRERVWNMLKALNELERSYLTDIQTGKFAELEREDG